MYDTVILLSTLGGFVFGMIFIAFLMHEHNKEKILNERVRILEMAISEISKELRKVK